MKWSVGLKISLMNLIAIIALIGVGIGNYISTDRMITAVGWRQHTYQVKSEIANLLALLVDTETSQRGYLLTKENKFLEPYNNAVTMIPVEMNTIKVLTSDNPTEQQRLEIMLPLITNKLDNIQQSLKLTDQNQELEYLNNGKKIMDNIRSIISDMNNTEDLLLTQRIESSNESMKVTLYFIIYGTGIAVMVLIVFGTILTRSISKPLKEMTEIAKKIAAGEIDNTFTPLKREDEVGILSQEFSKMSQSLQEFSNAAKTVSSGDLTVNITPRSSKDALGNSLAQMVTNLRQFAIDNNEVVNLLNTSVNEMFTSISQLVSTGSETATAVSETTTTIEQVRQTSLVSNNKAKSVSDEAQLVAKISQSGKKSTQETNDGMEHIRDQMLSIAESMMLLSEQTQGISSIVETVDDLAQQSSLLSFNASIEAEKAGEQGRGFRIVAQEIKSLADQSKQATHRVREILSDVQKATSTAVLATEQGNKITETGVKKSEEAGDAIMKLSNSVTEAAQAAIQIATSNQQQLLGLEQAAIAMENIKQASLQNVDSAKQLEAAAHNLRNISLKMQQIVNKYRIKADHNTSVTS